MTQISYTVDNGSGLAVRTNINQVLAAIKSTNSGNTAPSETVAYMLWADTANNRLKIRNTNDTAFVDLFGLDGSITMPDGTNSSPGMSFTDDSDTGIFSGADNQFNIATAGIERVRIDATTVVFNDTGANTDFRIEGDTETALFFADADNNRIGIGTANPRSILDLGSGSGDSNTLSSTPSQYQLMFEAPSGTGDYGRNICWAVGTGSVTAAINAIDNGASDATGLTFNTGNTSSVIERLRITSSGDVGINRGVPQAFNSNASGITTTKFEVNAGDSTNTTHETACFRGGNDGNDAAARVRIVHGGDRGMILDGGRTSNAAFGKISISDQNGDATTSVHIDSAGTWFWGKTAQSSATPGVELYKDGPHFMTRSAGGGTVLGLNDSTGTSGGIMKFYFQDVHRGSLQYNGSNFQAVNASDYRLKENDTPISDGITRVKQLRPIRFNWKTDSSTTYDGFFAHEVQNVVPAAVIGEKDSTIGPRGEGYQMMSNEPLIPLLTAAIKELIVKVEALESA
tara:strand:+ start:6046 stop:7587 length:1542 start_codon:yes stop_codon:yes gene_type:complete